MRVTCLVTIIRWTGEVHSDLRFESIRIDPILILKVEQFDSTRTWRSL